MGIPAQAAPGPRVLPSVHQVDQPGEGRVQAGRLQSRLQAVGHAQEQTGHELRNDGPSTAVLLPAGHPGQGRRPTVGVPVCRRTEGYYRDRLLGHIEQVREATGGGGESVTTVGPVVSGTISKQTHTHTMTLVRFPTVPYPGQQSSPLRSTSV